VSIFKDNNLRLKSDDHFDKTPLIPAMWWTIRIAWAQYQKNYTKIQRQRDL